MTILDLADFYVILGMNWLSSYHDILDLMLRI